MDLTISIVDDGKLETTLFEKPMNLYLYIPPHSSHSRGVFTGLVFGQVLRIRRLCSKQTDADGKISKFFQHLLARGHTQKSLAPLFSRAEENAKAYLARSEEEHLALQKKKWDDSHNQIFFHLQFHPERILLHAKSKSSGRNSFPTQQAKHLWKRQKISRGREWE
jgi:hypothetical protein